MAVAGFSLAGYDTALGAARGQANEGEEEKKTLAFLKGFPHSGF